MAFEVAEALDAPLDIFIVRKLGMPGHRELAMGAIASGGVRLLLAGTTVILVDDGLATGSTMRAAAEAVRQHEPARVIVAVPVGAPSTCDELADVADETICARTPEPFLAVGQWYEDFSQTTDDEVRALLSEQPHTRAREDTRERSRRRRGA